MRLQAGSKSVEVEDSTPHPFVDEKVDLPFPALATKGHKTLNRYRAVVQRDLFEALDERWFEERVVDFRVAGIRFVCPLLNDDLEYFFKRRARELQRPAFMKAVTRQVEGHGIFGVELDEWEIQRKISAPAFSLSSLRGHGSSVSRHTKALIEDLATSDHQDRDIDLRPFTMRWSSRINNSLVFSDDFEDQVDEVGALSFAGRRYQSQDTASLFGLPQWIPTMPRRRMAAIREKFLSRVEPVIRRRIDSSEAHSDVLDRLINAHGSDRDQTQRLNLTDLTISFLMAGTSPTSDSLAICLFVASRAPLHVEMICREVQHHAANGEVQEQDLSKLEMTRAFVAECLRYYPPFGLGFREVAEDMDTPIGHLRRGQRLLLNKWAAHHHKANWDKPEEFRIDRFLAGNKVPRFAYMPFSHGPFRCIGAVISREILVMALAQILQNISFSPAIETEFRPVLRPSTTYKSGIPVRIETAGDT